MSGRDMCANCGRWREEHYAASGAWMGDAIPCPEYYGTEPSAAERKRKDSDLEKHRKSLRPDS